MARKSNTTQATENMSVFSALDIETYAQANLIIKDSQEKAEGLAERIAGQLYIVSQKKLYELDDYKTVHEWAMAQHDIAKGTVSDSINTFARFGDGVTGLIKEDYQQFTFSTLMKMKNLTDEQIKLAGINPTMSRSQVIEAIKGLKVLEEKQAELPKLEKQWAECYKTLSKYIRNIDTRMEFITNIIPDFFENGHEVTPVEYEDLIREVEHFNSLSDTVAEFINENEETRPVHLEYLSEEVGFDITDQDLTEDEIILLCKKIEEYTLYNTDEAEESITVEEEHEGYEEQEEEQAEQNIDNEPLSMPTVAININNFRKDNGALDKKHLLDVIWSNIQEVENGNCDIIISKLA